ncbi:efflux RND transporter periplasmic adaptor subunit [Enterovibrio sp. ZSDZ35]|uniref:Efflux RND transporter periplasmic adaptor subunit n=1 Tax=Enterovibrio qingdaonensis TaxID=2899818 RepID=A0ABT5QH90_9GAMM|nr:efflux RND transporter periplasmic adaptor subunit [Enterovibrio sp. ZSDZ35]MDD1779850.1 efflux RND transporter periplasmic adaptor subunit [Enterovibrio sp. ZSDZ35]
MNHNVLSAAIGAILLLSGCQQEDATVQETPLYVSTVAVDAPVKNQFRIFKGQVVAAEQTPIAFRSSGEVIEVLVKAGDKVEKGDVLARLDEKAATQTLNDAKAQHQLAVKQLKRGRELFGKAMISRAELDGLIANQALTKAQNELAKNQLKYTRLVAPFSGTVSDVFKERFERVQPGEAVVNLYQDDKVYVQIELSDNVLAMITPNGQAVRYQPWVTFSGFDGRHQMTYLEHSNEPNMSTGSYELWLSMNQISPAILPGTTATVAVDMVEAGIQAVDGYQVPMTVLQAGERKGQFYVWKLVGDEVSRVTVTVAEVNGNGAVIATGISEGDVLVNSNLRKLREGKQVQATGKHSG